MKTLHPVVRSMVACDGRRRIIGKVGSIMSKLFKVMVIAAFAVGFNQAVMAHCGTCGVGAEHAEEAPAKCEKCGNPVGSEECKAACPAPAAEGEASGEAAAE